MLFSLVGEIGLIVISSLYVLDCWFNTFIDLIETMKNDDDKSPPMSEEAKRLYS